MAVVDEEKQESSFFERAVFFVVPVLFFVVLLGVLLVMLDVDVKNKALDVGQKIPVLRNYLPEAKETNSISSDEQVRTEKFTARITELEGQLTALQNELNSANAKTVEQEQIIDNLSKETVIAKQEVKEDVVTDEQYTVKIQELASMFSKMTASKAAPIIQSMNLEEMALIFNNMRADDRVKIMEKMTPKVAADVTMMLKDTKSSKDLEIAALQARVASLQTEKTDVSSSSQVSDADLAATFSSMEPTAAADMLLKMMDISSSKVLRILKVTDSNSRSAILEAMSDKNETTAAMLVTRLMQD